MRVKLTGGAPAPLAAVEALEAALGHELSACVKQFLRAHDGATPEANVFAIDAANHAGVNQFIPVAQVISERANVDDMSARAYPIAWAEGGNYVVIDEDRAGAVFFWDHETAALTRLADDLDAFLALLRPFDIASVPLGAEQIKSAWIDPSFAKRHRRD
ncbi:MAG: SMI1/KNR4 family protein [Acidobacteriota bacterium]